MPTLRIIMLPVKGYQGINNSPSHSLTPLTVTAADAKPSDSLGSPTLHLALKPTGNG